VNKQQIISIIDEIGTLLELKGENPFKVRAYHNAARSLETSSQDIATLISTHELENLPGIGQAMTEKITELFNTGKLKFYSDLKKEIPQGLLEMIQLPGLGPKKAKHLYEELGIKSIGELEYACHENRLLTLKGFGEKSQKKILEGIQFHKKNESLFLFSKAYREANAVLEILKKNKHVQQISVAGSLRRCKEVVKDIDFVAASDDPKAVMKTFVTLPGLQQAISHGETKSSVVLSNGIQVDLRCVSQKEFPYALHHFTGSKEHNVALRGRAQSMEMKMNEYGLFKGEKLIVCKSEEEIYKHLGLSYIPPEMRENQGEIQAAEKNKIPQLLTAKDIKGIFHNHTTYSDGKASLEEMVKAAQGLGLEYIGISDHSQSAFYAHGLKNADIEKQHKEIEAFNKKLKNFKIFKGIESDILADGSLDYDEKTLKKFDFVIASIHSRFKMTEKEMTERIIKALQNPFTTMLGHMTGRLLLSREPYQLDVKKIIDTAVKHKKIIELNANPYRLDIDWRHLHYAKEKGLKISINPDAHNVKGVADFEYGVGIARKGWMEKGNVINTMGLRDMEKYLRNSTRES